MRGSAQAAGPGRQQRRRPTGQHAFHERRAVESREPAGTRARSHCRRRRASRRPRSPAWSRRSAPPRRRRSRARRASSSRADAAHVDVGADAEVSGPPGTVEIRGPGPEGDRVAVARDRRLLRVAVGDGSAVDGALARDQRRRRGRDHAAEDVGGRIRVRRVEVRRGRDERDDITVVADRRLERVAVALDARRSPRRRSGSSFRPVCAGRRRDWCHRRGRESRRGSSRSS